MCTLKSNDLIFIIVLHSNLEREVIQSLTWEDLKIILLYMYI